MVEATVRSRVKFHGPRQAKVRVRRGYTKEKYLWELDKECWNFPSPSSSTQEEKVMVLESSVAKLVRNLRNGLDRIAPINIINLKTIQEPWRNDHQVKELMQLERQLWKEWKCDPTSNTKKDRWNSAKKKLKRSYGDTKSRIIKENIAKSLTNKGRSLWKGVRDTMNWKIGGPPGELRNKTGAIESKPEKMTEIYHDKLEEKVFNIMRELEEYDESIEEEEAALKTMFGDKRNHDFEFRKITKEELLKVLKALPLKTSHGDDGLAYVDIIDSGYYSVDPLLQIINLVIETGHWPSLWKNSIVKPLFKGTDKWDPGAYRPVSITNTISRITERVLNAQLLQFLQEKNIVLEECHGFVEGRGCSTAVLEILQELQEGVEEGEVPMILGVDISSAFDCISRNKLQRQLLWLGLGPTASRLFQTYFKDRTQQVEIGSKRGKKRRNEVGVYKEVGYLLHCS